MITYLTEVLVPPDDGQLTDLNSKINDILQHVSVLKADVNNVMQDRSLNFMPFLKENEALKTKVQALTERSKELESAITDNLKPKLLSSKSQLENAATKMKELHASVDVINTLQSTYSQLQAGNNYLQKKEFVHCTETVLDLQRTVKNNKCLDGIELYKILSQETVLLYEQMLFTMSETWATCVMFNIDKQPDCTVVRVDVVNKNLELRNQVIKAVALIEDSMIQRRFSKKLYEHVIKEIILKSTTITTTTNEDCTYLEIKIDEKSNKPYYSKVLENIVLVIEFIDVNMNEDVEDSTFLSIIGEHISQDLIDHLLQYCLSETIPSKWDDLEKYQTIVTTANKFQTRLKDLGFLPIDCSSIMDYAKNINILFANKCCQGYLASARSIMKKDLHNMVSSKEIVLPTLEQLPESTVKLLREKLNSLHEPVLSYPSCQISKSAEDVLQLVRSILDEVIKCQELCAVRLFYTIRNIFEMYASIVPLHHKKLLETIPQQVAIFHNNCLYYTYCLVEMACQYRSKLPRVLHDHVGILLEEAVVLRRLGTESLEAQVAAQRNQMVYILRDSSLATLNESPQLDANAEKSVRQCIRQLQILQTVWSPVLPVRVYNNVMGFLLDACLEELTTLILAVEDISSDSASELATLFTMIQDRTPALFAEPKEVHRFSRKWQRFKELILILGGSLKDINERWSDGVGPLAYEFTVDQIKHMVRALFQNTERRAALLAKIK